MSRRDEWEKFWQEKGGATVSDVEYDRGHSERGEEIERLSAEELLEFIDPQPNETIFDAGCGTGVNIELLQSRVGRIVAMDYNQGAVDRARARAQADGVTNVELHQGSITDAPFLPNESVDKILCMSVLQYLNDDELQRAFSEFHRVLRPGGIVILHVKNLSSLYLGTLFLMKKTKAMMGRAVRVEFYRTFNRYVRELKAHGFGVIDYNSFNVFMLEGMPKGMLRALQKWELSQRKSSLLRQPLLRGRGSDLKIKACRE